VRDIELVVRRCVVLPRQVLVQFARRDVDMGDDVALPQGAQHHFFAHGFAVLLVVDALCFERRGQLVEGNLVARGDFLQCAVELFVRNRQAHFGGTLRLDFLQHQALQHLLLEHALRGQFDLLLFEALGDRVELRIQIALQHHAIVDDRRDPIE
jgi:hypothetical protein